MVNVGVIGLGHIASIYATPEMPQPYCHVGGILHSSGVRLAAVADLTETARTKFRETWGACFPDAVYYNSGREMLEAAELDVVAVCVRGPDHYSVMEDVIAARPRAIFLEKPPTCSLEESDDLVRRAAGIPITVSYSRHWCPHVLRLEALVKEGLIGKVERVVGYCGHSVLSFASHTTDLICQFAGYDASAVYARGRATGDAPSGYEPEPVLDVSVIEFESGVAGVQIGGPGEHGQFYCDVFGTEGSVRAGIYIPPFAKDKKGQPIDLAALGMPEPASVFTVAYDQIAAHLSGGPLPACTDGNAWTVHEIGFAAIESILTGERVTLPNVRRQRRIFANG